jgi:endonuclease/exonuclease/phosphatase (EEP) superfamily protein YafD
MDRIVRREYWVELRGSGGAGMLLPGVGIALVLLAGAGCQSAADSARWEHAQLRVMTYNLFVDRRDFEAAERVIRAADADVVFLQEVTTDWEPTLQVLRDCYPYQELAPDDIGLGNALLSRLPLDDVHRLPARHGWHGAWFAEVETPVGQVQLLGVHLTPPLTDDDRFTLGALLKTGPIHRREIEAYCEEIDFDEPLIVLGDFNENEGGAAASWLRRQRLQSALARFDLFTPTWRWVDAPLVSGRLDHVFHSAHLQPCYADVVNDGASDHWPVVAAFNLPDGEAAAVAVADAGGSRQSPAVPTQEPGKLSEDINTLAGQRTDSRQASAFSQRTPAAETGRLEVTAREVRR